MDDDNLNGCHRFFCENSLNFRKILRGVLGV